MASRRMFSLRLIDSARFLKMPISSQALYFHLGMHADDDGVVEAYSVVKAVGCSEDDLKVLVAKGFIQVLNEDLVTYITDWQENNRIRPDRKIDSIYKDLLIQVNPDVKLIEKRQRADSKVIDGQPVDNQWTTSGQPMDGIGKDSIGEVSIGQKRKDKDTQKSMVEGFSDDKDVQSAIYDFIKMRNLIKRPMSDRALTIMLNKLKGLSSDSKTQIRILEQSIEHSWQTVYELKDQKQPETPVKEEDDFSDYVIRV